MEGPPVVPGWALHRYVGRWLWLWLRLWLWLESLRRYREAPPHMAMT